MTKQERLKGFTLLELLIVIAILSILAMALILVLNPAETMKKGRDTQRMTDLSTLKTALGLYVTNVKPTDLNLGAGCLDNGGGSALIYYSAELADTSSCAAAVAEGGAANGTFSATDFCKYPGTSGASSAEGSGWIPVDFSKIPGGAPISNLPLDPTNTIDASRVTAPTSADFVYRYACQKRGSGNAMPSTVFEINAVLESDAFTTDDKKAEKDGGDNTSYYEVGTNLKLLPTGTNF